MGVIASSGLPTPGMPLSARVWTQAFLDGRAFPLAEAGAMWLSQHATVNH